MLETNLVSRGWWMVALLWLVGCLNYLDRVMITTMHGSIVGAIPMTEAQFGLLTTSFLVVYAVLSPFAGFLADRFKRSHVIVGSLLVWSLVTWLTAHAKTYEQLLATRLLMGISEACYVPASLALISDYHRGATRSLANGILLTGIVVGSALGGLGGWLAERHSWGYAFNVFGLVGILYAVVLGLFLRDAPPAKAPASDPTAPPSPVRLRDALVSLFGNGSFIVLFAYWGLLGVSAWVIVGWTPTYLQEHFHLNQGEAGLTATVYLNVASVLGLVVGGIWADRWGLVSRRACIFVTAIGLCAAAPGVMMIVSTHALPVAIAGLILYGLASAFTGTEMMPILCLVVDSRYRATGFGILNLCACMVGGATIYAGGALRDASIGVEKLFALGAAGMILCAVLLLFIKPRTDVSP